MCCVCFRFEHLSTSIGQVLELICTVETESIANVSESVKLKDNYNFFFNN